MKPKHLFFVVFLASLVLSDKIYFEGSPYLGALTMLIALASALNASKPGADKKASFKDIARLFVEQK